MDVSAIVVGSGPAGISCALALLEQGCRVTLVDAGITLETNLQDRTNALSRLLPSEWPKGATDFMTDSAKATISGVQLKTAFGSYSAYYGTEIDVPLIRKNTEILPSFARGGLSTVWGAAVLPFQENDFSDWPVKRSDLEPHYRAIFKHIPLAAVHDDLDIRFPLFSDNPHVLRQSRQALALFSDLSKNRDALKSAGILFGQSRLAVHAPGESPMTTACVFCGMCLSGCPYGAIYNAADTLDYLQKQPGFQYLPKWVAKRVSETKDEAVLEGIHLDNRQALTLKASRIFLAGGVLSTTKILLESLQAYDQTLTLATSQHFMFPWLRRAGVSGVTEESLHTLAQIFIEIDDPQLSRHTVHLQLYTYNNLIRQALRRAGIGYLLESNTTLKEAVYGRLLITQGYLHSEDSSSITVTLKKSSGRQEPILTLEGSSTEASQKKIRAVLKKLSGQKKLFGAIPIASALRVSLPGGGFHAGGTFPMRKSPKAFESDSWGRPQGFQRVHAADATVFPSIAATTITLNIMANAHRIASYHG